MRNRVSISCCALESLPRSLAFHFHSLCARPSAARAAAAGLPRDFAIYDDDDQLAAVKLAMTKLQIETTA